ncbi:expressed unknown protein [Seminavis robusta]|uniref:Uncharacterized protein n=1 Tax=Seminavis robusta TaxID=568900 RepID=A0A9N8HLG5_9STRA|nr:expressed unknown protein [Seminavis robusta]|eukprot:Sro808_g205440.1 n/a (201) ;mRNA; f:29459-30061
MIASLLTTLALVLAPAATAFVSDSGLRSCGSTARLASPYPDPQALERSPASDYGESAAGDDVTIAPWKDVRQWPDNRPPAPLMSVAPKGSVPQGSIKPTSEIQAVATPVASKVPAGFKDIGIAEGQKFEFKGLPEPLRKQRLPKSVGGHFRPQLVMKSPSEGWIGGSDTGISHYPGDEAVGHMEPFMTTLKEGVTDYLGH